MESDIGQMCLFQNTFQRAVRRVESDRLCVIEEVGEHPIGGDLLTSLFHQMERAVREQDIALSCGSFRLADQHFL